MTCFCLILCLLLCYAAVQSPHWGSIKCRYSILKF
uniref:Uncharacterized protein n=1 Tax=Anguilla anguilla TaxID=7936 RepID=A0A0E9TZ12_ANGAN